MDHRCDIQMVILVGLLLIVHGVIHTRSQVADIVCKTTNVTVWDPYEKEYSTLLDIANCDMNLHCLKGCMCVLSNGTVSTSCDIRDNPSTAKITYPSDRSMNTLYLANQSLTGLEESAFSGSPDGLEILYLNNNSIAHIRPGAYVGLSRLTYLYLAHNVLRSLPSGVFTELSALHVVDLQYNLFSRLQTGIFDGLSSIRRFELGYNMLREIQHGVFQGFTTLEELDFDNNEVEELRVGMFDGLTSLLSLDVDFNMIQKVPSGVFKGLVNLEELDLDNNLIGDLPSDVFHGLSAIKELELDSNKLEKIHSNLLYGLTNMEQLALSDNMLSDLEPSVFDGLVKIEELHLSKNYFATLHPNLFQGMRNLEFLFINNNRLAEIHLNLFKNLTSLKVLSLSYNKLTTLSAEVFVQLRELQILNMSGNHFNRLDAELFKSFDLLTTLELTGNPLQWITGDIFDELSMDTNVYVDNYATCCFIEKASCTFKTPPSPFLTCKRLLPYEILRIFVWVVGIAAIVGNMFVLYTRCFHRNSRMTVQFLLISNLSISDLLMGIYMIILVGGDMYFTDYFPSHSESWRQSIICKLAGSLSLLSSEASVFFITMISIDRFQGVKYPFSDYRIRKTSAKVIIIILWVVALILSTASSLIPVFAPDLYDASEVCVGLPLSRINSYVTETSLFNLNTSSFELRLDVGRAVENRLVGSKSAMFFSIAIFVGLNLFCFLIVAYCYAVIFHTARKISSSAGRTMNSDTEIRMAIKMAGIVFTDFCCWMIVVVLSILGQSGAVTINPAAYAWIATFLIPINSCINPFLYTLITFISDRLQRDKTEDNSTGISMTAVK